MPPLRSYTLEYSLFPRVVPVGWSGDLVAAGDYEHTQFREGVEYAYELQSTFYDASGSRLKEMIRYGLPTEVHGTADEKWAAVVKSDWAAM